MKTGETVPVSHFEPSVHGQHEDEDVEEHDGTHAAATTMDEAGVYELARVTI